MNNIHIGTSGWHYRHWKGPFYPERTPSEEYLSYYARHFSTVEINNSFYRLPDRAVLKAWRGTVPENFVFAAKASRYITEAKKLKDPVPGLTNLFGRICALEPKLGPVLFQLPPRWRADPDRLRAFVAELPRDKRYAFEFREPSWFSPEVFRILRGRACAFCISDFRGMVYPEEISTDFTYLRFHGPGLYPDRFIDTLAERCARWASSGIAVYCYFNNDYAGYAVQNARALNERLAVSNER